MKFYTIPCLLIPLLFLPGCTRIYNWFRCSADQGTYATKYACCARCYLRSVRVYDQVDTDGMFDALWLSDEVRMAYVNAFAFKNGTQESQCAMMLRRQLEDNNHFISFYVLSLNAHILSEKTCKWSVTLCVDGKLYQPLEVKEAELGPEYVSFFGCDLTRFKKPYLVRFNAKTAGDALILQKCRSQMKLIFRTVDKQTDVTWCCDNNGNVPPKKDIRAAKKKRKKT